MRAGKFLQNNTVALARGFQSPRSVSSQRLQASMASVDCFGPIICYRP